MNIGQRIKERRVQIDMSVDDLADLIGKSRATIYRYESGEIEKMPSTILLPIAKALRVTPAYLMGWEDNMVITNSIVGNNNHNIVGQSLGDVENELVSLCKEMTMQQKVKLLSFAYEILGK